MFLSWITEIFGCVFSVDYVLQLSGVSLCLLLLNIFFSEFLLCVVALARFKSRRAGANTSNERSAVRQILVAY